MWGSLVVRAIDKVCHVRAREYLPGLLAGVLNAAGRMRLQDDPAAVYGKQLGFAGEKHVRAAMNQLVEHSLAVIEEPGQVRNAVYRWLGHK